jgi:hypothetical protein
MPRYLYYMGARAAVLAACGKDDNYTFYTVISKFLAIDLYGKKTVYDQDVLLKGLADGWLTIYINPDIFADTTIKNKIDQGIKILKTTEARPAGFYKCLIIPHRGA